MGYVINLPVENYANGTTEQQHYNQLSGAINTIKKDLDGYGKTYSSDGYSSLTLNDGYGQLRAGSLCLNYHAVNGPGYNVETRDAIIGCVYTQTGTVTITLPSALLTPAGRMIWVCDAGGNANVKNITIKPSGSGNINGGATYTISTAYGSACFCSTGFDWISIST